MNEDNFNLTVRKFLKIVGVTSQREIEKSVREALGTKRLHGDETLAATITLRIGAIDLVHEITGKIELGGTDIP